VPLLVPLPSRREADSVAAGHRRHEARTGPQVILSWQIVPTILDEMMADPDRAKAKRACDAMLKMVKLDIAALQAAYAGTAK
jgi:hypothetical protein